MTTRDTYYMRMALSLAQRAWGHTSPNPLVGAVLVKNKRVIGKGWHHAAGQPHAEIEAFTDAARQGFNPRGSEMFVTLEPCSTHGRTPPCTDAILAAGVKRVVVSTIDPNPRHGGNGLEIMRKAGIKVELGLMEAESLTLNEAFHHWIVHHTPFVTVKAGMTLDGKIATASGESKWITCDETRQRVMHYRMGADAILVGIQTVLADDPNLTVRDATGKPHPTKRLRRIILDSHARTPLNCKLVTDEFADLTTVVVTDKAPKRRVAALSECVRVLPVEESNGHINLACMLRLLGAERVTSLLVEGGGEVNGSFLAQRLAHRILFIYAPKIMGGRHSRNGVSGDGVPSLSEVVQITDLQWEHVGVDMMLTARVKDPVLPHKVQAPAKASPKPV